MQKINYDLGYLIQFLDVRSNDLLLFASPKETLSDQFDEMSQVTQKGPLA